MLQVNTHRNRKSNSAFRFTVEIMQIFNNQSLFY